MIHNKGLRSFLKHRRWKREKVAPALIAETTFLNFF